MKLQSILVVALALVFGGSAAVGVRSFVNSRGTAAPKADTVPVVVVIADISRGEMITSDVITMRNQTKDMVPAGALTKPEDAIGRVVAIQLVKDETVLAAKLLPKGARPGLEAFVLPGMRAFTIHTPTASSGVAGFVMPGNMVDVLLTVTDWESGENGKGTRGAITATLLQRVEVLAVDQHIDAPADNKVGAQEMRSVTLLVTPDQANLVDLGQNKGTLHLSLRNQKDEQDANTRPATTRDLPFHQGKPWDAKEFLSSLAPLLAPRATSAPAPAPTPTPAPAPAPEPVVATPPPAPPRSRFMTIYRGPSGPTYQQLDQQNNGEPRAQATTDVDQADTREVPPPATRAIPEPDTRSGATP